MSAMRKQHLDTIERTAFFPGKNEERTVSMKILKREARLLTLEELKKGIGHGWEECWLIGDDEDPERFDLEECVFLHGHLILESGSTANANSDHWQENYNKRFGMRVWEGIDPPTEEQRKAEPWAE